MELDEAHFELYPLTNWTMVLGLLSHVAFIPLFLWLEVQPLALFNVASVGAFAAAIVLARRAHLNASLLVASAEVTAHAVYATYLLGWDASFHYHAILAIALLVMFGILSTSVRAGLAALIGCVYLALAVVATGAEPVIALDPDVMTALTAVNAVIFLTVLSGICVFYTWTVALTRKARDEATDELRGLLARSQELERMKTDFTSMVSHELRTPLTSILGFAKVSQNRFVDRVVPHVESEDRKVQKAVGQVRGNLDIIISEGERLTDLINDLLDIAKMEAGQMDYASEPIQPAALVIRAAAICEGLFAEGAVELESEHGESIGVLQGDPGRLVQVLVNLVSNASKFTVEGSVTISARRSDAGVMFSVTDTGPGLSEEDQAMVFEKFRQTGSLHDRPKGTGLGLAICRQIVEAHDGSLGVESRPGEGARFFFEIPLSSP